MTERTETAQSAAIPAESKGTEGAPSAAGGTQPQTGDSRSQVIREEVKDAIAAMSQGPALLTLYPSPADRLRDAEVHKFFLGVLQCDMPAEEKYKKFVDFFELDASLSQQLASRARDLVDETDQGKLHEVLASAAEDAGLWKPQEILAETEDSLRRAVRRLLVSQHRDGGWGFEIEVSHIWATVYSVLALYLADRRDLVDIDLRDIYERGLDWLIARRKDWSVEDIPLEGERSIYELSAVIGCLSETGRDRDDPEVHRVVSTAIDRLRRAQNDDGGWDRSIWGTDWPGRTRIWSETGATGFALQALAAAGGETCKPVMAKGIDCLASAQNADGSWNIMITRHVLDRGARSVTKTCNALKGILAGRVAGIDMAPYRDTIAKGVEYLQSRELPIFTDAGTITGWGWHREEQLPVPVSTFENTTHTLETLLQVEDVSLPPLTANASWLIHSQFRAPGSLDDGKWASNETGRITLALLRFYEAIKTSPLFASATGDA
jgi:hypothetical protein